MSNLRHYYRIGTALMAIGGALTIWSAFQMPHKIATVIIWVAVGIAATVPMRVLIGALLRRLRGAR